MEKAGRKHGARCLYAYRLSRPSSPLGGEVISSGLSKRIQLETRLNKAKKDHNCEDVSANGSATGRYIMATRDPRLRTVLHGTSRRLVHIGF